ncbi:MAG: hypothetical protein GXP55_06280, partial [Deltaproteobacteria bacterium]|nr:hypothetical protein [Deltaproteobacteria bacterium]
MSRQSMSLGLHPSLIAVVALFLSGCAGVLGVSALATGVPVRVEMSARADATASASGEAAVAVSTGEARADVRVETRDIRGDADVASIWQTPTEPAPLPDPFAVAASMLVSSEPVQVASVGAVQRPGVDARVESAPGGDLRVDTRGERVGVRRTASQGQSSNSATLDGSAVDARVESAGRTRRDSSADASWNASAGANGSANASWSADADASADAALDVDARVEMEARRQAVARVEVGGAARSRRLGGGAGVRGLHGRPALLGALIEGGLNVDGSLTDFTELAPLALGLDAAREASLGSRIDTGP